MASDPSGNLARRYRRLFRLPSLPTSVAITSLVTVALAITVGLGLKRSVLSIIEFALITELVLLLSVEIDNLALKSGIATFRRLAAISILSNLVWLALAIVGSIVNLIASDEQRFVALVLLGLFFAVSFRLFVLGSVFYGRTFYALPLSLVQPAILAVPIFELQNALAVSTPIVLAVSFGAVYIVAVGVYLYKINDSPPIAGLGPLQLLQAFLSAWVLEDPRRLESVFDKMSKESLVDSGLLRLGSALIVVPGIHPGPFYPVGSSNLPGEIYHNLKSSEIIPMTVHSISDHELNLPSKEEVSKYVSTLKDAKRVDAGTTITTPIVRTKGKATATGIAFGATCLVMLTRAPYGMEDFPPNVRSEIESFSKNEGFNKCLVIDTHNSEGSKPTEEESKEAIDAAKEVISQLKISKKESFTLGSAHSTEIANLPRDVGPGGVGLLVFGGKNSQYCLVIVDANNSKLGYREELFARFEKLAEVKILEICTSDTHVTAARTMGAKGYLALGDITPIEQFSKLIKSLYEEAKRNMQNGSYSTMEVQSRVKTIGGDILDQFSSVMDKTSNTAKYGAKLLAALGFVMVLLTII